MIAAVPVAAFLVAAGVFVIRHDWLVEELMERVHEGNRSPWAIAGTQARAEVPPWESVRQTGLAFVEMGQALESAKSADIRDAADGYVAAATGFMDAATRQDPEALRGAFGALERSCNDCHHAGGVGGTLAKD
jgi:hypothetical protein